MSDRKPSPSRSDSKLRVLPPAGVLAFSPAVTNALGSYVLSPPKLVARAQLTNVSENPVKFKIKTNASRVYTVNPVSGVIEPGATQDIVVKTASPKAVKPTVGGATSIAKANATLRRQGSSNKVPDFIQGHIFLVVADGENDLYLSVDRIKAIAWFSSYDILYICILCLVIGLLTPYFGLFLKSLN